MPSRDVHRSKFIPLDIPYIQFTRDVQLTTSHKKPKWPTVKRLKELSTGLLIDEFFSTNINKTRRASTPEVSPQSKHEHIPKKPKPFSFSLQQKREFPWSNISSSEIHDFRRRSYEKPNKRAYQLPVDPLSRLVWDERVAPSIASPVINYLDKKHFLTDESNKIGNQATDDGSFNGPSTSVNIGLLPTLQASKNSPRQIPKSLRKVAKTHTSNPSSTAMTKFHPFPEAVDNDAPSCHFAKDKRKHVEYRCGSLLDLHRNLLTGLPELSEVEKRRPANISRYHANCYDSDDDLDSSWTLPRIEMVLQSEGMEPGSIMHQIDKIRSRKTREYDQERRLKLKQMLQQRKLSEDVNEPAGSHLVDNPDSSRAKEEMKQYFQDIENIRWISQQQIERGIMVPCFPIPRIVLISSQIPRATRLIAAVKDDTILPLVYDFSDETLDGLLKGIRLRLDQYHHGYFMKSLLLFCLGGPGYLYFLKRKLITRQKLEGKKHPDLSKFFNDLGRIVSKVEPKEAFVHLAGGQWPNKGEKTEFIETLKAKTCPNRVNFECVEEETVRGEEVFRLYFDYGKYLRWKERHVSESDGGSSDSPGESPPGSPGQTRATSASPGGTPT